MYKNEVFFILGLMFIIMLNINSIGQPMNIEVGSNINAVQPQEPTIVINPYNVNEMMVSANLDNCYRSDDGGYSWNHEYHYPLGHRMCDPCLLVDTAGSFLYIHLKGERIMFQKLTDITGNWSGETPIITYTDKFPDKEFATLDRRNNHIYVTWTEFDAHNSGNPEDSSFIVFSKSVDIGETWTAPVRISNVGGNSTGTPESVHGSMPAVGPDGTVYATWLSPDGIKFNKSTDEGDTWLDTDIHVCDLSVYSWISYIPGIEISPGFPIIVCDTSSACKGNIYIVWYDSRNGMDDADVWLVKSTDAGMTWTSPIRVNDDTPGKHQFFSWMTVDPVTGYIYVMFYDRRNYPDDRTDVYLAVSMDGGETFDNQLISETPFVPYENSIFGHYNGISAYNNVVRPVWTRMDNGVLSVWTAIIDEATLIEKKPDLHTTILFDNFPNPFRETTTISFELEKHTKTTLKIYDLNGEVVATMIHNEMLQPGRYAQQFGPANLSIKEGYYYYALICDQEVYAKKMIYIK